MNWMGEQLISSGKIKTQQQVLDAVNKVTIDDLHRVANATFKNSALNLAVIGPVKDNAVKKIKGDLDLS